MTIGVAKCSNKKGQDTRQSLPHIITDNLISTSLSIRFYLASHFGATSIFVKMNCCHFYHYKVSTKKLPGPSNRKAKVNPFVATPHICFSTTEQHFYNSVKQYQIGKEGKGRTVITGSVTWSGFLMGGRVQRTCGGCPQGLQAIVSFILLKASRSLTTVLTLSCVGHYIRTSSYLKQLIVIWLSIFCSHVLWIVINCWPITFHIHYSFIFHHIIHHSHSMTQRPQTCSELE